jgi:hypothetical protein
MDYAFEYIEDYGIDTEGSYPYTGVKNISCWYNKANVGATCSGNFDRYVYPPILCVMIVRGK